MSAAKVRQSALHLVLRILSIDEWYNFGMNSHLVALSHFGKIGPVGYQKLVERFGTIESAWKAERHDLEEALTENIARSFAAWRTTIDPQALFDDAVGRDMKVIAIDDPGYPILLKAIHDPPFILYYRGTLPPADALCIGIVGSRQATDYGLGVAHDLAKSLAPSMIVVSGLAYGIDEAAHRGALDAGGLTVAVLASGLDGGDSSRKEKLTEEILSKNGCIMSEFPPEMPPLKQHFPIRNRIVAGMSKAVIIVEAAEKSGSLITARAAIAENREVFAVPGPITSPTSQGTNLLCKNGAHVVTHAQDIFDVLGIDHQVLEKETVGLPNDLTDDEKLIVTALSKEPRHIDDLVRAAGKPQPAVAALLAGLELQGIVKDLGGMRFSR